jgi:hypothetical protein
MEQESKINFSRICLFIIGISNLIILISCVMIQCWPYYELFLIPEKKYLFFLSTLPSIIMIPLGICPPISKSKRVLLLYLIILCLGLLVTIYNLNLGHFTGLL